MPSLPAPPSDRGLLLASFVDAFCFRFAWMVLALYAAEVAGIGGFAVFTLAALVAAVVVVPVSPTLVRIAGPRRLLVVAATVMAAAWAALFAGLAAGVGVWVLAAAQFIEAASAAFALAALKFGVSQRSGSAPVASRLAWVGVCHTVGVGLGALVGALASWALPVGGLVASGIAAGFVSLAALIHSSRHVPAQLPAREGPGGVRLTGWWRRRELLPLIISTVMLVGFLGALSQLAPGVGAVTGSDLVAGWVSAGQVIAVLGSPWLVSRMLAVARPQAAWAAVALVAAGLWVFSASTVGLVVAGAVAMLAARTVFVAAEAELLDGSADGVSVLVGTGALRAGAAALGVVVLTPVISSGWRVAAAGAAVAAAVWLLSRAGAAVPGSRAEVGT